jgi:probable rRNA maturation factor
VGRGQGPAPLTMGTGSPLDVVVLSRLRRRRASAPRLRRVLRGAAEALGVRGEVCVVLSGDRVLRRLNRRFRGKDRPTDVLSFAGGAEGALGDIVISVETAERNARGRGRTLAGELDVLVLHGFLHLLGHDHETDHGTMDRLERRLRRRLTGQA